MNVTLSHKAKNIDRDVAKIAVSQLNESAIRKMASESPEIYYAWCVDAYTAQRKARLELEFQSALLRKLKGCDPSKARAFVVPAAVQSEGLQHVGH